MSAPIQLGLGINPPHNNQFLFSDHYLENLLPQDPRWDNALPEADAFLAWLWELYKKEQDQLDQYSEAQLEAHWFRPIFTQLGHVFEGQVSIPGLGEGIRQPDYAFFPDNQARQQAVHVQGTEEYAEKALAVGEVKRWDTPLGKKVRGSGGLFDRQNPSYQIDYYIRSTELTWGVLTNGRLWRLYHKDTSQRLQIFYEVDLVDLLTQGDPGKMRYFTMFFQQEAFRPDTQGRVFLEDARKASNDYAVALEDDLEDNVYQALELIMQGFLDLPQNALGEDDLREVYDNSLYLLYRFLFILYAESRGLLPLENETYREHYSLRDMQRDIANDNAPTAPMTTVFWGRVLTLFHIIDGGNPEMNEYLGVPRYNGGLFSPELHPFLEEKGVGDAALIAAIDLLSRRRTAAGLEFVDYRTLGVRHLGSIYEGLLEYQPRYATEAMVAVKDGKDERWILSKEAPENAKIITRRELGKVYLVTDRGERKATGSYYTPQYIVEYIVENTLGPLVYEARERVKARAKAAPTKVKRAQAEQSLIDEVLSLKVLDPAMGSGHFLVEATEYLALELATDPYVETEVTAEEDLTHWKRRVVERCIYGVDRNPLAVELAKLSLWLATVAADKPLSFLDHHLQCGDSLIGAKVKEVGWAPDPILSKKALKDQEQRKAGQIGLFEMRFNSLLPGVIARLLEITEQESDSYETVQAKEAADEAIRQLKAPFEAVADLWMSAYFGHEFEIGDHDRALSLLDRPNDMFALSTIKRSREIGVEHCFFHWELAFPEVFYSKTGMFKGERAGFDAVIGNPPYGATFKEEKTYLSTYEVTRGKFESYVFFIEKGLALVKNGGALSFIVPSYWLVTTHTEPLRDLILSESNILEINTLTENVFFGVRMDTMIFIFRKIVAKDRKELTRVNVLGSHSNPENFALQKFLLSYEVDQDIWKKEDSTINVMMTPNERSILSKIVSNSVVLGSLAQISQGLTLYRRSTLAKKFGKEKANTIVDKRLFHAGYQKDHTFKKEIGGDDVSRYAVKWSGSWVSYGDWLAHRVDERFFVRPRIVLQKLRNPQLGTRLVATFLDDQITYSAGTLLNIISANEKYELEFILALINSTLLNYWYRIRVTDVSIRVIDLKKLPICRITFITPELKRARLTKAGIAEATEWIERIKGKSIESVSLSYFLGSRFGIWLDSRLSAASQQSDVIHDLLANLAEQMIEMNEYLRELENALDPFKYLDRGVAFEKLPTVFANEIKYGELVNSQIDRVHHDVDGLRLLPAGEMWELQVLLKLRDPEQEWQSWQYEEDGNAIARIWEPVYRLPLGDAEARYYQHAAVGSNSIAKIRTSRKYGERSSP